jgi:hypothetical protein
MVEVAKYSREESLEERAALEAAWEAARDSSYEGPRVGDGLFADHYVKLDQDKFGEGYGGQVFLCKRIDDSGPSGKVYCAKVMNGHAYWTIDCEVPSLKITNNNDVVKLYDVFDRRNVDHEDKSVTMVYEACEGNSLSKVLETRKAKGIKDLPKEIFLKWSL